MPESSVNFTASTHQGTITVGRSIVTDGVEKSYKLDFAPAEAAKATEIIGLVLSMLTLKKVPSHINNSPFVIRFFPKQVYALERNDASGSLPFRAKEADELIQVIDMGLGICLNEQTQGRAVPVKTTTMPNLVDAESF